jgi:SlyX protein
MAAPDADRTTENAQRTTFAMNDSIERLELKLAFLERANQELSDVVYRQQQELEELRARVALLVARIDALKAGETTYTPEQERPPHY